MYHVDLTVSEAWGQLSSACTNWGLFYYLWKYVAEYRGSASVGPHGVGGRSSCAAAGACVVLGGAARSVPCSRRCGRSRVPLAHTGAGWRVTVRSSGQWSAVRVSIWRLVCVHATGQRSHCRCARAGARRCGAAWPGGHARAWDDRRATGTPRGCARCKGRAVSRDCKYRDRR